MVLHQQWHSSNFNPGHYVAIDVPNQTIVVAFRGTFHTKDAVSDLVVKPVPFTVRVLAHFFSYFYIVSVCFWYCALWYYEMRTM